MACTFHNNNNVLNNKFKYRILMHLLLNNLLYWHQQLHNRQHFYKYYRQHYTGLWNAYYCKTFYFYLTLWQMQPCHLQCWWWDEFYLHPVYQLWRYWLQKYPAAPMAETLCLTHPFWHLLNCSGPASLMDLFVETIDPRKEQHYHNVISTTTKCRKYAEKVLVILVVSTYIYSGYTHSHIHIYNFY